ncbi:hypothetical protein [Streptomyces olivaceus]|uniref:hypothetical protein n=1 Tax=Streptomyces olivaceus TaxID=47716 RepID=UPI0004C5C486|nr:hypothetical protein [Streptomyces olivaceus]MBZ6107164.1 hypothetical protein [Streptomyces olivaceus]
MSVFFGDYRDFSDVDFRQLDPAHDDLAAAQDRLRQCRASDVSPTRQDLEAAIRGSWRRLRELSRPLKAGGDRLYVLAFEAPHPFVKVGRSKDLELRGRIVNHEHDAAIQFGFLFDAWVSDSCPDAYPWEQRVLDRLDTVVASSPHVTKMHKEYYYGLPFHAAVLAAEMEQDSEGTAVKD